MKKCPSITALSILSMGLISNGYAHHSNAPHFDTGVEITMDAVVTDWKFVNPHAYIYFDVTDENGQAVNWRCESSSSNSLRTRGFTNETFVVGQELTISGNPARREDNVCFMTSFMYPDGTLVNRNTDIPADKRTGEPAVVELANTDEARPAVLANGQPNISGFWVRQRGPRGPGGPGRPGGARPTGPGGPGAGGPGGRPAGGPRGPQIDMTEAGLAAQAKYEQIYDDPGMHCDIANIFFGWGHDGHVNSITQEDDTITLTYGYMDYVRTIHLNQSEHPQDIVASRGGHSIGTWEENVLVVDTVGFTAGVLHPLSGASHSDQMHTTERFWYDAESKSLKRSYVAEDPLYLSKPYTGEDSQAIASEPYTPYNCTELSGDNNKRPEDRSSASGEL